jgi:hypothetical protein
MDVLNRSPLNRKLWQEVLCLFDFVLVDSVGHTRVAGRCDSSAERR